MESGLESPNSTVPVDKRWRSAVPIRFRCDTCNGKLSIATRKIGTPVECPRCNQSMMVPSASQLGEELTELLLTVGSRRESAGSEETQSAPAPTRTAAKLEDMPLFERSDFEKLLDPRGKHPTPLPLPVEEVLEPLPPVNLANYPDDAIVLSRTKATVLAVGVVVLLGLAFGLGFLVRG